MSGFSPALDEVGFALRAWADLPTLLERSGAGDMTAVDDVVREAGRFAARVLAPLDEVGHREGCELLADGSVRTPTGWDGAYGEFVKSGWNTVHFPAAIGGQDLPAPVSIAVAELFEAANVAFCLSLMPFAGVVTLLDRLGTPEQKRRYLEPLVSGRWSATLAMTEAHAGTDIGSVRTRAEEVAGEIRLKGQKCFISYGEHGMNENIVHFVLARDPSGKPGGKGLSLYLVPKRRVNDDGTLGNRNDVTCLAVERKMGVHGSPTTVMQFGGDAQGAWGERLGEPCKGLEHMFIVLNRARLNIGVFGLASAERALQAAQSYAHERIQGVDAEGRPCAIARHPDVRRMLLEMRCGVDSVRAVAYFSAGVLARAQQGGADSESQRRRLDFLTPIVKGWGTEVAFEVANTGVQVAAGAGYMDESAAARCFLDARVHPIYEGTTGIQSLDLALRKVGRDGGAAARELADEIRATWPAYLRAAQLEPYLPDVQAALSAIDAATTHVVQRGAAKPQEVQAGAVHYLMMWGTLLSAWLLTRAAAMDPARTRRAAFVIVHRLGQMASRLHILERGAAMVLEGD